MNIQSETEKEVENQLFEEKIYNVSDFQIKNSQRILFWMKNFTTCQIWNQRFKDASDFELKVFQSPEFRVYLFCSLSNFHALVKIGHNSVMPN